MAHAALLLRPLVLALLCCGCCLLHPASGTALALLISSPSFCAASCLRSLLCGSMERLACPAGALA